jgi:hypothetical protein
VHSSQAKDVVDRHFLETVVRIHRAGEGAPFTGLKPAGLGHGPVLPMAQKAIETGSAGGLVMLEVSRRVSVVRQSRLCVRHLQTLPVTLECSAGARRQRGHLRMVRRRVINLQQVGTIRY